MVVVVVVASVVVGVACVGTGGLGHVGALVSEQGSEAIVESHTPVTQPCKELVFIPVASQKKYWF